jgi:hypothetical protein
MKEISPTHGIGLWKGRKLLQRRQISTLANLGPAGRRLRLFVINLASRPYAGHASGMSSSSTRIPERCVALFQPTVILLTTGLHLVMPAPGSVLNSRFQSVGHSSQSEKLRPFFSLVGTVGGSWSDRSQLVRIEILVYNGPLVEDRERPASEITRKSCFCSLFCFILFCSHTRH